MKVGNSWLLCPGLPQLKAESLAASQNPPGPGHTGSKRVAGRKLEVYSSDFISENHQVFDTNLTPHSRHVGSWLPPWGSDLCGRAAREVPALSFSAGGVFKNCWQADLQVSCIGAKLKVKFYTYPESPVWSFSVHIVRSKSVYIAIVFPFLSFSYHLFYRFLHRLSRLLSCYLLPSWKWK